jgi:mRNA-degrading endonuclease RelE of RelBE toxin-antitoxin system
MKIRKFNESLNKDLEKEIEYICESLKDFTYVFMSKCELDENMWVINPEDGDDFCIEIKPKLIEQLEETKIFARNELKIGELFVNSKDFNSCIEFINMKIIDLQPIYRIRTGDDYSIIIYIKNENKKI